MYWNICVLQNCHADNWYEVEGNEYVITGLRSIFLTGLHEGLAVCPEQATLPPSSHWKQFAEVLYFRITF